MVVSTSVRPLSRKLKRKSISAAKVLYLVMAVIVGATAIVGLGYVPAVSARVPQLASLSTSVEDAVGRAVQWSREIIGQPPAPPKKRPVAKPTAPKPKPQTTTPKPAPVGQKPPSPQKPAVQKPKPVATLPAPKPAPKPAVAKPTAAKKPVQPIDRPRATASAEPLLQIGSRAPPVTAKDLRGVIYRLSDYRGRRLAVLMVSSLDESGRTAVRAFLNRFSAHPGYLPIIVITNPDRVAVRRLAAAAAGTRVPILLGDKELQAAFRLPRGRDALFVISERGAIAQARLFGRQ
ncbi:MAG: hypothetical protein WD140_06005 [bacterium]